MKMRKIIALLLALCMLLSLSISAFAADDVVASGTIPDSKIKWALDSNGWLTISGSDVEETKITKAERIPKRRRSALGGISGADHRSLVRGHGSLEHPGSGILV